MLLPATVESRAMNAGGGGAFFLCGCPRPPFCSKYVSSFSCRRSLSAEATSRRSVHPCGAFTIRYGCHPDVHTMHALWPSSQRPMSSTSVCFPCGARCTSTSTTIIAGRFWSFLRQAGG